MAKRPLTAREIANKQPKVRETIKVQNISKQLVTITLKPPRDKTGKRIDFFLGADAKYLKPGKVIELDGDRVWSEQLSRLSKSGMVKIL